MTQIVKISSFLVNLESLYINDKFIFMASFNTINFENNKIFVIIDNSNIFWFNAKQICKSLNYVDTKQVISNSIDFAIEYMFYFKYSSYYKNYYFL